MVEGRNRRNRILCLHGPSQSAASFRAALKPTCDQMGKHFEFHFLEAPYIVPDKGEDMNEWTNAATLASHIVALETDESYQDEGEEASGRKDTDEATCSKELLKQVKRQLNSTEQGREVEAKGAHEDIESLVSRKTGRSLSRDWVSSFEDRVAGVQLSLAQIGDYMRENGSFHGVIGYETGGAIALLIQTLLSYPYSSAKQFPSFFPRLPKGVNRMQRMGGWEEEPPAPDDPRLGLENLPRNYVPSQKPFEMVISLQPNADDVSFAALGVTANEWMQKRPSLLTTISSDAFSVHSVEISAGKKSNTEINWERRHLCKPGDDILSVSWSHFLSSWMTLSVESYLGDKEAKQKLLELKVTSTRPKL